jgi:hypothetical protein
MKKVVGSSTYLGLRQQQRQQPAGGGASQDVLQKIGKMCRRQVAQRYQHLPITSLVAACCLAARFSSLRILILSSMDSAKL